MSIDFFEGVPDPVTEPMPFLSQRQGTLAMRAQGQKTPQGQMVNGQYVAPAPVSYANQLAGALMGGYKTDQMQDAARTSNVLNGGAPTPSPWGGFLGGGR